MNPANFNLVYGIISIFGVKIVLLQFFALSLSLISNFVVSEGLVESRNIFLILMFNNPSMLSLLLIGDKGNK